jgi:lipopolysaccharide biosynthesis glycosyltransferase
MAHSQDEVTVAFGVDAGYAPHLAATLASIVANAPGGRFRFMVIHDGIPKDEQRKIEAAAPNQTFDWPEMTDAGMLGFQGYAHISRASYYRLAIPKLAPTDAKRVIYLDADLIVLGDLRELAATDLGDTMIGAVFDPAIDAEAYARRRNLAPRRLGYFNSGVLLIDVEKARQTGAFDAAVDVIKHRFDELEWGDQCALNIVLWNRWTLLDAVWNVQRRMLVDEGRPLFAAPADLPADRRPKIIHFTEEVKPWSRDGHHPFIWTYYRYLRQTPYWKTVNDKAGNSTLRHVRRFARTSLNLARLKA